MDKNPGEKQEGQSKDTKSRDTKAAQESSQSKDEAVMNVKNHIMLVEDTVLINDEAEKNDDGHDVETVDNVDVENDDVDVDRDGGDSDKENQENESLWFCELCSLIPSQVSDLVSKFTGLQKEIKAIKSLLEDMKKSQNSENSKEIHGNANTPVKNNTTAPVEKESEIIEFDTSRHIVEENIHQKRQNKELKE